MSNFFVNQSLSINQRRNARLNEYFAVVGLPEGPLLLSDPPLNAPDLAPVVKESTPTVAITVADGRSNGGSGGGGVVVHVRDTRQSEDNAGRGGMGNGAAGVSPATAIAAAATAVVAGGISPTKRADASSSSSSSNNTASTAEWNSSGHTITTEAAADAADKALSALSASLSPSRQPKQQGVGGASSGSTATTPPATTTIAITVPPRPLSPLVVRPTLPPRRRSYGSCELGLVRAKSAADGMDGPLHARFRARVLHRFPAYDHEGYGCAFPANLPLFCLPGGFKLTLENNLPTFFTFVHTRANGQHMFGYCLCLHEPLGKRHRRELQELVDTHNQAASRAGGGQGTGGGDSPDSSACGGLEPDREVYAPKCLCLLSTWPHFGPFREWLLNLYRISLSPFQIPLERYISNFVLEVPTPSPGRVEVLYNMGNTTITFACPPPNKPVAWGSVPFDPLFQCLSHHNILTLFSCLLLERSILLKSSQLSLLTPCAEVLALVLYPLSWSHVYIPVLPEALLGVLAAPMPFLIGVHRSFLEDTGMDVATYVVQVDLDNDIVEMGMDAPMPGLPPKRRAKLLTKLGECAQLAHCRTPEYRQDVMQKSDLAFSMAVRPCDFDEDELDTPPPDWDAVREAFLRFFVAMLAGYRRCLVYPTKVNPNPARLFNVDDYLEKLERDSRPFAEVMCDTQAFQNFIDARIQPEAGDLDVVFFDACIAARHNRSLLHVTKKSDANFLRPETFVKAKTVFALTPDTTGLDLTAPARSHERFPALSHALYPIPRDIPSLSNPTNDDSGGASKRRTSAGGGSGGGERSGSGGGGGTSTFAKYFGGSSRRGDADGNGGGGGGGAGGAGSGGKRGSTSFGGGRGVFTRGASSRGSDDDWNPLSAEATVFAIFIIGFCATIGVDPPVAAKRGGGTLSAKSFWSAGSPSSPPVVVAAAAVGVGVGSPAATAGEVASTTAQAPVSNTTTSEEAAVATAATASAPATEAVDASAAMKASVATPPAAERIPPTAQNEQQQEQQEQQQQQQRGSAEPSENDGTGRDSQTSVCSWESESAAAALSSASPSTTTATGPAASRARSNARHHLSPAAAASTSAEPAERNAAATAAAENKGNLYVVVGGNGGERGALSDARFSDDASTASSSSSSSGGAAPPPALLPALTVTPAAVVRGAETAAAPVGAGGDGDGDGGGAAAALVTVDVVATRKSDVVEGSGGGGKKSRKSSRLAFSELKNDVREERLYKANAALVVAFEALDAMQEKAPSGEEAVFRSLISACGRCGNSDKAMAVVEMMMSTGIVPDAMVSRCLVDAFAMDDSFSDGGAHPLSLLDWSKFQPKHRDGGRRSHETSGTRSDTSFSFKKMMKRFNEKSDTSSPPLTAPSVTVTPTRGAATSTPPTTHNTTTMFRAKSTAGSVVLTPSTTPPRQPPSYATFMGLAAGTSVGSGGLGSAGGGNGGNGVGDEGSRPPSSTAGSTSGYSHARDSFGAGYDSPVPSNPASSCANTSSTQRGRRRSRTPASGVSPATSAASAASAAGFDEEDQRRSSNLRLRLERSASPYTKRRGGMSMEMQQQVLLGERILERLFPDLKIDNGSETCPSCQAELTGEQVRAGWSSDPNDYTTECRAVLDLQAAALAAAGVTAGTGWGGDGGGEGVGDAGSPASGGSEEGSVSADESGGAGARGGTGASATLPVGKGAAGNRNSSLMGLAAGKAARTSLMTCGRRFVSRFSVHSTAPGWQGTTGPGTPLWCEYLPPWVLRKEFHTILAAYGVQYLCSERFRQGLGPAEGSTDPSGVGAAAAAAATAAGGASSRAVDRTIFWNLVVQFREQCLPITFLLADASTAVRPALTSSNPGLFAAE